MINSSGILIILKEQKPLKYPMKTPTPSPKQTKQKPTQAESVEEGE